MVSVENQKLRGGGFSLKQKIWNMAKDTIEEWTGEELTQCRYVDPKTTNEPAKGGSIIITVAHPCLVPNLL
jgi:hypothetical protein